MMICGATEACIHPLSIAGFRLNLKKIFELK
jgi:hypothetical protein